MKQIWLGAVSTAVLLSGCAPVMYSTQPAPVVSLNPNNGVAARQPVSNLHPNNAAINRATPDPTTRQQAVMPAPTPAAPLRPPVQADNRNNTGNIKVEQASPYGKPAVAEPYRGGSDDDGWNVAANSRQSSGGASSSSSTRSEESSKPQTETASNEPLRPKKRSEEAAAEQSNSQARAEEQANDVAEEEKQVASIAPVKKPSSSGSNNPVSTLLKKASASLGKGDLDGAAAYLENAHRINPKNAKILYDIANIRYHQGRFKDAENFAGRATNAGGSNAMMKKAWALIANARKSLGDNQGAIAAAEKAASL